MSQVSPWLAKMLASRAGRRENMRVARELLQLIQALPGQKIVTLSLMLKDEQSEFVFDVSESGVIGYHKDHKKQFLALLKHGIHHSGGLIVRQFTHLSYEAQAPNGKWMRFPYKMIYSAFLGNDSYFLLSKEETLDLCTTDAKSGKKLEKEIGVLYRGWDQCLTNEQEAHP